MLPLGLIIIEDLGTALVIIAILAGIILVSGITWKILVLIYGILGALAGTVLYLVIIAPEILEKYLGIDPYQFSRRLLKAMEEETSGRFRGHGGQKALAEATGLSAGSRKQRLRSRCARAALAVCKAVETSPAAVGVRNMGSG